MLRCLQLFGGPGGTRLTFGELEISWRATSCTQKVSLRIATGNSHLDSLGFEPKTTNENTRPTAGHFHWSASVDAIATILHRDHNKVYVCSTS